ncbi:MAG: NrfD/PsrC family molybdoenzyme membrane anchor subunit [Bacteroidales bacterium]
MKIAQKNLDNLKKFSPYLESTSPMGWAWIIFLVVVILLGFVAIAYQWINGQIVTGMRDYVSWSLYKVNFIFFMGIGLAGALTSSVLHLLNPVWKKPIVRISELMAIISLVIGPVYILCDVGRLDRLMNVFIYARLASPITWDVIAILMELIVCIVFLYLGLIHNFAILRDYNQLKVSAFRKKMYRFMAINYENTPEQKKQIEWAQNVLAVMVIPMGIIVYSVIAWLFGMTKQAGWDSTIFGPYFVVAASFAGIGALIIVLATFRKFFKFEEYITLRHFNILANTMLLLAFFYGYLSFSEYFSKWYGYGQFNAELIARLFDFSGYGPWFVYANFGAMLIPMIILAVPKWRTITSITASAIVVVTAVWIKCYLIIIPTLESQHLPIQDSRPEWISYTPSLVEIALTLAGFATFCLFLTLASKFVTVLPSSVEMEEPNYNN